MDKKTLVTQIIVCMNYYNNNLKDSITYNVKFYKALKHDINYVSDKLKYKALMRLTKMELIDILHDLLEDVIYA